MRVRWFRLAVGVLIVCLSWVCRGCAHCLLAMGLLTVGLGLAHGGGDCGLLFVFFFFFFVFLFFCFFVFCFVFGFECGMLMVDCGFLWVAGGDGVRCVV